MMGGKHKGSKQIKFEQVGIYYTLGGGMALATSLLPEGKKYFLFMNAKRRVVHISLVDERFEVSEFNGA